MFRLRFISLGIIAVLSVVGGCSDRDSPTVPPPPFAQPPISEPPVPPPPPPRQSPPFTGRIVTPLGEDLDVLRMHLFPATPGYRLIYTQRDVPNTLNASSWYVPLGPDAQPSAAPMRIEETLFDHVEMGGSDSEFLVVVRRENDRIYGVRTLTIRNRRAVLGDVQALPFTGQAPSTVAAAFHPGSRTWGLLWTEGFLIDRNRPGYLYGHALFGRADAMGRLLPASKIALSAEDPRWTASLSAGGQALVVTDNGFFAMWSRDGTHDHFLMLTEVSLDGRPAPSIQLRTEVGAITGDLLRSDGSPIDISYSVPATSRWHVVVRPRGAESDPIELGHPHHASGSPHLARSNRSLGVAYSESVRAAHLGPVRSELWFGLLGAESSEIREVRISPSNETASAGDSPCGLIWHEQRFAIPHLHHTSTGGSIARIALVSSE